MTRDSEKARKCLHELSRAILKMQTKNAQKLVSTIEGFISPFSYQENDIINLVTKAVMLEKINMIYALLKLEFKDGNLHSITYQNGTSEFLGKNAKASASNLVCLFKKCTCSNIKQSFRIKSRQRVFCEKCRKLSP